MNVKINEAPVTTKDEITIKVVYDDLTILEENICSLEAVVNNLYIDFNGDNNKCMELNY